MNKNHLLIVGVALIVALLAALFFAGDGGASDLEVVNEEEVEASDEVGPTGSLPVSRAGETSRDTATARSKITESREAIAAKVEEEVVVDAPAVRVRVVDQSGRPVGGVPVLLREVYPQWANTKATLNTDAEKGEVVFKDVAKNFRVAAEDPTWDVSLDVLIAEPSRAEIDPENLPSEVIVLEIPSTGTVEVNVLDENWEGFDEKGNVKLSLVPIGERREISPFSRRKRPTLQRDLKDGKAVFEFVELGMDVQVAVKRESAIASSGAFGEGPRRHGETVQVEVRLGSDHPVARVRAVREDGSPIVTSRLSLEYSSRGDYNSTTTALSARTDTDGYFLFGLDDWIRDATRQLRIELKGGKGGEIAGVLDLSRDLEDGINDLGDVVLGSPPVFVAGRVIAASGEPIAKADLNLRVGKDAGGNMRDEWNFRHKSDENGRFEITEVTAGGIFQLSAQAPGHACEWFGFEPGERNLTIRTSVPGGIAGSVLLDEGVPAKGLMIAVNPLEGGIENLPWKARQKSPDANGEFLFDSLLPGARKVSIQAPQQDLRFLDLDDVHVLAGEVTRDPRLQSIDLRGAVWVHDIEILGLGADERPNGSFHFRTAGEDEYDNQYWMNQSSFQLFSKSEFIDIKLAILGYRVQEISGAGRHVKIQLKKGVEVTLVLVGEARIPEPPIYVKPSLAPTNGTQHSPSFGGDVFDESREVVIRTPHTGRLRVEWLVEMRSASSSFATSHVLDRKEFVDVLDIDGGQRFEVSLSQEEMDELASLLD